MTRKQIFLAALLVAFSCASATFIGEYSEVVDGGAMALHRKLDAFLSELQRTAGTDDALYDHHVEFYDELRTDLEVMRNAAALDPNNKLTVRSLDLIAANLRDLEAMHAQGMTSDEIPIVAEVFDTQFRMLAELETAKKREVTP